VVRWLLQCSTSGVSCKDFQVKNLNYIRQFSCFVTFSNLLRDFYGNDTTRPSVAFSIEKSRSRLRRDHEHQPGWIRRTGTSTVTSTTTRPAMPWNMLKHCKPWQVAQRHSVTHKRRMRGRTGINAACLLLKRS
jgi:hypothetical protein